MSKKPKAEATDGTESPIARAKAAFPRSGHLMEPFLAEYEKTENQSLATKTVGSNHDTVANWKKNPDFMKLFTEAHIRAHSKNNDSLKSSALQRAINGTVRYVMHAGKIVMDAGNQPIVNRDFETQLTMFMLKNRMPDEFRDKFEHEISGQLIVTLASEFLSIVRKHATPEVTTSIQKELETLSAKLVNT